MTHRLGIASLLLAGCSDYDVKGLHEDPVSPLLDTAFEEEEEEQCPDAPPEVSFEAPLCDTVVQGRAVNFSAFVVDDGDPDDLWLRWESDRDGLLAEGTLQTAGRLTTQLSPGGHLLSLLVEDACGNQVTSQHTVQVVEPIGSYLPQSPDGLGFDADGLLWVADWTTNEVVRMDPHTFEVIWRYDLPYAGADGVTQMTDQILVSFFHANHVLALDACTGAVIGGWPSPTAGGVSDVAWDGKDLWTRTTSSSRSTG